MIHLLRSLAVVIHNPWATPQSALQPFQHCFRVMPWDCDLNIHLTNGRYPQQLDLARTAFFLRIGSGLLFARQGWRSVLASQTLTFIREIKPFALVDIESRVLSWDQKYFYIEHRFMVSGRLHAKALARVAMLHLGKVQPFDQFLVAIAALHQQVEVVPAAPVLVDSVRGQQVQINKELLVAMRQAEADYVPQTEAPSAYPN